LRKEKKGGWGCGRGRQEVGPETTVHGKGCGKKGAGKDR